MDESKSCVVDISHDGLQCKGQARRGFASSISNFCVTQGKWYYEVEMITCGLFQIGWATDQFKADPEGGMGVGDDEYSWAIDLFRKKKWHKDNDNENLSYAVDTTWQKGGIVQVFLDLDKRAMIFGYQGKDLGAAYTNFDIGNGLYVGFSCSSGEELRFNFGDEPFKYLPPLSYLPLSQSVCVSS
eukprot:TRINITY_DN3943_c0_g1_i1.p1 TRINITY_DN3943_c0_g1~~TRINITY_DN3943_c0_g1_i1.p1  ORF type:complete len:207 (-),score=40.15 TRINITY_DN3943_c0_g1_i1:4-558(-)